MEASKGGLREATWTGLRKAFMSAPTQRKQSEIKQRKPKATTKEAVVRNLEDEVKKSDEAAKKAAAELKAASQEVKNRVKQVAQLQGENLSQSECIKRIQRTNEQLVADIQIIKESHDGLERRHHAIQRRHAQLERYYELPVWRRLQMRLKGESWDSGSDST